MELTLPSGTAAYIARTEGATRGLVIIPDVWSLRPLFTQMCDDLAATMEELRGRGAIFEGEVGEQPWGSTVELVVPGAGTMTLYQPKYTSPALD